LKVAKICPLANAPKVTNTYKTIKNTKQKQKKPKSRKVDYYSSLLFFLGMGCLP
jgi:hypothetical protein